MLKEVKWQEYNSLSVINAALLFNIITLLPLISSVFLCCQGEVISSGPATVQELGFTFYATTVQLCKQ